MEIFILVLLYYLSQNPAFAESVKPLMGKIKDSEQMLNFLNDLSKFSGAFGGFTGNSASSKAENAPKGGGKDSVHENGSAQAGDDGHSASQEDKINPQSPTQGIADEFIQNILDSYLKKR